MKPPYINMNVKSRCPDCGGALSTFEYRDATHEFGSVFLGKTLREYAGGVSCHSQETKNYFPSNHISSLYR